MFNDGAVNTERVFEENIDAPSLNINNSCAQYGSGSREANLLTSKP